MFILEPPGVPENIRIVILENNEVLISWRHGFNGGYKQTFVIQLSTDDKAWYNITFYLRHNDTSQECWTILNGLDLDKTYYIRIYSFNILGRSDFVIDPELKFALLKSGTSVAYKCTHLFYIYFLELQ